MCVDPVDEKEKAQSFSTSKRVVQYEVGYGKPPAKNRFQKGASGNPKGRPKGSKNLATVVLKESRQFVHINGPRGIRTVTKLEAAVMQLGNKSAQGDLRAQREFFALVHWSEESVTGGAEVAAISETDLQLMENLRRRIAGIQTGRDTANQETLQ